MRCVRAALDVGSPPSTRPTSTRTARPSRCSGDALGASVANRWRSSPRSYWPTGQRGAQRRRALPQAHASMVWVTDGAGGAERQVRPGTARRRPALRATDEEGWREHDQAFAARRRALRRAEAGAPVADELEPHPGTTVPSPGCCRTTTWRPRWSVPLARTGDGQRQGPSASGPARCVAAYRRGVGRRDRGRPRQTRSERARPTLPR